MADPQTPVASRLLSRTLRLSVEATPDDGLIRDAPPAVRRGVVDRVIGRGQVPGDCQ